MIKLLFVEDDAACAYAVQGGLELLEVYDVRVAHDGKEALEIYKAFRPDVVVSDIEMPMMDGFELARAIRDENSETIILLATGLTSPRHLREGYRLEIDEYVKKPYIAEELHYRIQAIWRRARGYLEPDAGPRESQAALHIGHYRFDPTARTLTRDNRTTQQLTAREAQLLLLLHDNKNRLVKRSEILQRYWSDDDPGFSSRSLDVFISKLRGYLAEDPSIAIVNERGKGLRLEIGG